MEAGVLTPGELGEEGDSLVSDRGQNINRNVAGVTDTALHIPALVLAVTQSRRGL